MVTNSKEGSAHELELHSVGLDFVCMSNPTVVASKGGKRLENASFEASKALVRKIIEGNVVGVDNLPHIHYENLFNRMAGGLHNPGINVCFMNVILQVLTHSPYLSSALLRGAHGVVCLSKKRGVACTLCLLEQHIKKAIRTRGALKNPLVPVVSKLIYKNFHIGRQEDAYIFLKHLIESLIKSCYPSKYAYQNSVKPTIQVQQDFMQSVIGRVLGGHLVNVVECDACKYLSRVLEPFFDISIDVHHGNRLEDLLGKFVSRERLDGNNKYFCPNCKRHQRATKSTCIHRFPRLLNIALKRFGLNSNGCEKNQKRVYYPRHLAISVTDAEDAGDQSWLVYDLYAIVCHIGKSLNMGHYTTFIKGPHGFWNAYDDAIVKTVSLKSVLEQNSQVYLLFYAIHPESLQQCTSKINNPQSPNKFKSKIDDIVLDEDITPRSDASVVTPSKVDVVASNEKVFKQIPNGVVKKVSASAECGGATESTVEGPKLIAGPSDVKKPESSKASGIETLPRHLVFIDHMQRCFALVPSNGKMLVQGLQPYVAIGAPKKVKVALGWINSNVIIDSRCNLFVHWPSLIGRYSRTGGYAMLNLPACDNEVEIRSNNSAERPSGDGVVPMVEPSVQVSRLQSCNDEESWLGASQRLKNGNYSLLLKLDSTGIFVNDDGSIKVVRASNRFTGGNTTNGNHRGGLFAKSNKSSRVFVLAKDSASAQRDVEGVEWTPLTHLYVDAQGNVYMQALGQCYVRDKGPRYNFPGLSAWLPCHRLWRSRLYSRFTAVWSARNRFSTDAECNEIAEEEVINGSSDAKTSPRQTLPQGFEGAACTTLQSGGHPDVTPNNNMAVKYDVSTFLEDTRAPKLEKWSDDEGTLNGVHAPHDEFLPKLHYRDKHDIEYDRGKVKRRKTPKAIVSPPKSNEQQSLLVLGKHVFDKIEETHS